MESVSEEEAGMPSLDELKETQEATGSCLNTLIRKGETCPIWMDWGEDVMKILKSSYTPSSEGLFSRQ